MVHSIIKSHVSATMAHHEVSSTCIIFVNVLKSTTTFTPQPGHEFFVVSYHVKGPSLSQDILYVNLSYILLELPCPFSSFYFRL